MLASSGTPELARGSWVVEPKLDGWRATIAIDPGARRPVTVRTRTGRIVTDRLPELAPLADLGHCVVLDGELVLERDGVVDFYGLGVRMMRTTGPTVTFSAFDLIWCGDEPVTQLRLEDRRRLLEALDFHGPAWCTIARYAAADAATVLASCEALGHEGIVHKRIGSVYRPGQRTKAWVKQKTTAWRRDHGPRRLPAEARLRR